MAQLLDEAGGDAWAARGQAEGKGTAGPTGGDVGLGVEGVDYHVGSVDDLDPREWMVPPHCIPIHANVTTYEWSKLYNHTQFDVIMMDPPWQLATANPTRGVALGTSIAARNLRWLPADASLAAPFPPLAGYSQLSDDAITSLPIPKLQQNGFLFIWVINAKYQFCLNLFEKWGYEVGPRALPLVYCSCAVGATGASPLPWRRLANVHTCLLPQLVDELVWIKQTTNRRLAKSHGYYLQHAKEVCLVGRKGADPPGTRHG